MEREAKKTVDDPEGVALLIARKFDASAKVTPWYKGDRGRLYITYNLPNEFANGGYIDLLTGWIEYPFKRFKKKVVSEDYMGLRSTHYVHAFKNKTEEKSCQTLDEIAKAIFLN